LASHLPGSGSQITQRLSVVVRMERLVVLERGRITGQDAGEVNAAEIRRAAASHPPTRHCLLSITRSISSIDPSRPGARISQLVPHHRNVARTLFLP